MDSRYLSLPVATSVPQFGEPGRPMLHVLTDNEALHLQARLRDWLRRCHRNRRAVVAGDHAAHGDAAKRVHAQHHGIKNAAAHVSKWPSMPFGVTALSAA